MESKSQYNGIAAMSGTDLNVLSVGISTGGEAELAMLKANPLRKIVATTLDDEGLEKIRIIIQASDLNNRIEIRREDVADPNVLYENNRFDFVYARLVLHYLSEQNLSVALNTLHRILKPNGRLYVVVRSTDSPELTDENVITTDEITKLTTYKTPSGSLAVRYFHTIDSISTTLLAHGFSIESIKKYDEDLSPDFMRISGMWQTNNLIEVIARKGEQ